MDKQLAAMLLHTLKTSSDSQAATEIGERVAERIRSAPGLFRDNPNQVFVDFSDEQIMLLLSPKEQRDPKEQSLRPDVRNVAMYAAWFSLETTRESVPVSIAVINRLLAMADGHKTEEDYRKRLDNMWGV